MGSWDLILLENSGSQCMKQPSMSSCPRGRGAGVVTPKHPLVIGGGLLGEGEEGIDSLEPPTFPKQGQSRLEQLRAPGKEVEVLAVRSIRTLRMKK